MPSSVSSIPVWLSGHFSVFFFNTTENFAYMNHVITFMQPFLCDIFLASSCSSRLSLIRSFFKCSHYWRHGFSDHYMGQPVNKAYPKDRSVMAPGPEPKFCLLLPQTVGKKWLKFILLIIIIPHSIYNHFTLCLLKNCKPQHSVWLTPYEMIYLYTK